MKLSITFLAMVFASIGSINASPTPSAPQSGLKQLTRAELVRQQEMKHLQKRAVPLPSNKGYPTCSDPGSGTKQFAVLTRTYLERASLLDEQTRPTPDDCSSICAANPSCAASTTNQGGVNLYYCYLYSTVGTLRGNTANGVSVRGSCADAISGSNYIDASATCCEQYL